MTTLYNNFIPSSIYLELISWCEYSWISVNFINYASQVKARQITEQWHWMF